VHKPEFHLKQGITLELDVFFTGEVENFFTGLLLSENCEGGRCAGDFTEVALR